ncbi:hypothetical protein FIA58_005810 [Flavobacterium jejuense]|uniref:HTH cro/C1-type domain-containing protein n=1 Tax=Flavobacterium jejuense TaxID=1544455 RepID=A0ABX0IN19_9FLAO|nr:hypothetical protein [Flavobacterium jejuense]NHN25190.1 hypothetical protein [Flavobacterium jejuense]
MQTFFKRLLLIVDFQGFKNINDFALNGLKYDSSSKLNRLKDEKNKPSVEILLDIAHFFPKINTHWLITGKGDMLLNKEELVIQNLQEPNTIYKSEASRQLSENYATLKENITLKDDIIKTLKEKIELQEKQLVPFESIIEKLELRIDSIEQFNALVRHKLDINK